MTAGSSARRPGAGRAAHAVPAANPWEVVAVIRASDRDGLPPPHVPSSRTIARLRQQAEAKARNAAAAQALHGQVQRAFRPPPGKVFGVDAAAQLLIGPAGALGTSTKMARTLEPLAAGGRHALEVLLAAGSWADEASLREALAGLGPKLAALGLRVDRRKAGVRIGKAKPAAEATSAA